MSATFNPYGFSHVAKIGGKPRSQTLQFPLAPAYNVSLAAGDVVSFSLPAGGGYIVQATVPTAAPTAAQQPILGIFVSVQYTDPTGTNQLTTLWTANTPVAPGTVPLATVDVDPGVIYQAQINSNLGAGLTSVQSLIGVNVSFAATAPNANTKTSTMALAAGNNNVWQPFKIIGLAEIPNNAWNDAYPEVLVVMNNTALKQGTLGNTNP